MIAAFKEVLLPYAVYLWVLVTVVLGMVWRAELSLFVFTILVSLPTLWYPTQVFPLGKDTMDLLVFSTLVGAWRQRVAFEPPPPKQRFIILLMVVGYIAVWKVSFHFSLPWPVTRDNAVLEFWKNYCLMMLLYIASYKALRTEQHVRTLVMIVICVLLFMVWREVSGFVAGESFSYNKRANGPFWVVGLNANHFGAFVAHYSLLALGIFAVDKQPWRRRLCLAAFIGSLYPLFYSYSRGAYMAVLAGMMVLGLLRYRFMIVIVVTLLFTWQQVLPDSVIDRIQTTETEDGELEESAALRIVVWELAEGLFLSNPIFGIGFDGFFYASEGLRLRNTHNYYLQMAAEQGVIGIVLLLMVFGKALASGWRLYKVGSDDFLRGVGMGYVICTVAVMVTNVFGDRYSQLALGSFFWILLGAIDRAIGLSTAPPPGAGHVPAGNQTDVRPVAGPATP